MFDVLTKALKQLEDRNEPPPPPANATDALFLLLYLLVDAYAVGGTPIGEACRQLIGFLRDKKDPLVASMSFADRMTLFPVLNFLHRLKEKTDAETQKATRNPSPAPAGGENPEGKLARRGSGRP